MSRLVLRIGGVLALLMCLLAPAQAQSGTSGSEAAARELIATMKADEQFKAMLPMILKTMKPAIVQNRPDVDREFDAFAPKLMAGMNARISELSEGLVAVYSSNFSADELRAVTAFYHTPAGQKCLQKAPLVMQQSMAVGQKIGQSVGAEAQRLMIEELRSKGITL